MRCEAKTVWKAGRWLFITVVLLSLKESVPPDRPGRQEDAQVAALIHLARTNLQARLDIRAEAIAVESARPLIFPWPAPDTRQERHPGYMIRLAVSNVVYEYNGRMLGKQTILWGEVETDQPLNGEGAMPAALQQIRDKLVDMIK
jgi:hypothetical protein